MLKRVNPVYLFLAFNLVLFLTRSFFFPEYSAERFTADLESFLDSLGLAGYGGVAAIYIICSFFFIPLLIPLNIVCGALYGPYLGTLIAMISVTIGCITSTVSVRYVFTGMQKVVVKRPLARRILKQIDQHGTVIVIMVRLAFVVPYLFQNIILALTSISAVRLAVLTAIGSLPGVAIYSFVGAGLMQMDNVGTLAFYLAVPLALLGLISYVMKYLSAKYSILNDE